MNDVSSKGILTSPRVATLASGLLGVAIAFMAVQTIATLRGLDASPNGAPNVITVTGEGKAAAAPDLATISFTVSAEADAQAAAQDAAAKKMNAALAALKSLKIADKDIQTSSYNISPRYSSPLPCGINGPCQYNGGAQKIIGYTASEYVTVKVRNTNATGPVLSALGGAGITDLSGPNFTIEDPNAIQTQARTKAIADARSKANELARELGVHIVRVANYSEGGGGYPGPMLKAESAPTAGDARTVPSIPTGQNEVTVDVSVTYEIR